MPSLHIGVLKPTCVKPPADFSPTITCEKGDAGSICDNGGAGSICENGGAGATCENGSVGATCDKWRRGYILIFGGERGYNSSCGDGDRPYNMR